MAQTDGLQILSTATWASGAVAPGSLVSAIGGNVALSTAAADPAMPAPLSLAGTSINVIDSRGTTRPAPLLFASGGQVNFLLPPDTAAGPAALTLTNSNGDAMTGSFSVAASAPGLFSIDGTGLGIAVGEVLRLNVDGSSVDRPVGVFDAPSKTFVPIVIDAANVSNQDFLFLYGTGIRNAHTVEVTANGQNLTLLYAGPESDAPGLDQVNVELPASLTGAQSVDLVVTADGQPSNVVNIIFR